MRQSLKVLFYVKKSRALKNGEYPILMRITHNGSRVEAMIKRSVAPDNWNKVLQRAIKKDRVSREINKFIETLSFRVMEIEREINLEGKLLTASAIKERLFGSESTRRTVLATFDKHNVEMRKLSDAGEIAAATALRYETCRNHIAEYIRFEYRKDDFLLAHIDKEFIRGLEIYLKTERDCNHNTSLKYMRNFKKIIIRALNNDWIKKDPFQDYKFHFKEVERDFLEENELKRLIEKKISIPRIAVVRDIYVFCCFTGLAFTDVKELKEDHVFTDNEGKKWIRKARRKTNQMSTIPILNKALEILEKYQNNNSEYLLPVLSNQKMNAYLKEIADLCGIKKNMTTHTARHTFATTVTLANKISIESVSKMLGHSSINMTKNYAKILDSTLSKEMASIMNMY
ncbi:MAG TPA: site-specific integrase [Edaphocola sp.]|nr:site-specific integrase [Edaphocola sp.]